MHIRNLPLLDYYSPAGTGDIASLGPTWQSGYFDATVSIDVVWSPPVTRRVNVRDAVNGFAGQFNENQATVTWSASSTSGFGFTSNPGNFSTSVPEVPGVNGVTAPLNFFAQVGKERNGVFFPAGNAVLGAAAPQPGQLTLTVQQPVLQAAGAGTAQAAALLSSYPGARVGGEIRIGPNAGGWSTDTSSPAVTAPASNGNQAGPVPASFAAAPSAVPGAPSQVSATALPLAPSLQTSATDLIDAVLAGLDGGTLMRALRGDEVSAWTW
jgi:hypothetical protein